MNRSRFLLPLLLISCSEPETKQPVQEVSPTAHVPAANTVVASDSMRLPDELNEMYYSVEVVATHQSANGVYEVLVSYGHNDASTQITMPEAETPVIPAVRRGAGPNEYIIGFRHGSDTTFNDYFLVRAGKGRTEMKYLKAYSFK